MNRFSQFTTLAEPHDLTFLAGTPYVYHCHHFNLFHDQTIDDVLGEKAGFELRMRTARDAFVPLLQSLFERASAQMPSEKIDLAQNLFASMGQGRIAIDLGTSGPVRGAASHLHYGFAWREKYGDLVRHTDPVDSVAAGLLAAVAELLSPGGGPFTAQEDQCVAARAPSCSFTATRGDSAPRARAIDETAMLGRLGASEGGKGEDRISAIADGLQSFVRGVEGDDRGLIQAFNVLVTQHLSGFYADTSYAAIRRVEALSPAVLSATEDLFREAGHVCVFNTFGHILLSPEWEGMVGPLRGDPDEIVEGCTAIARGLGFGRWAIGEHVPGKRLVLRATSNYEAPVWLERYGAATTSRSYFMQGAALAIMVLATRVAWRDRPKLTQRYYEDLFRGRGLGFKVETPRCLTMGHPATEVVVTVK